MVQASTEKKSSGGIMGFVSSVFGSKVKEEKEEDSDEELDDA
jgi:hypothetical protein